MSRFGIGLVSVVSRSCFYRVSVLSWSCLCLVSVVSQSFFACCLGDVWVLPWSMVMFWSCLGHVSVVSRACVGLVSVLVWCCLFVSGMIGFLSKSKTLL